MTGEGKVNLLNTLEPVLHMILLQNKILQLIILTIRKKVIELTIRTAKQLTNHCQENGTSLI